MCVPPPCLCDFQSFVGVCHCVFKYECVGCIFEEGRQFQHSDLHPVTWAIRLMSDFQCKSMNFKIQFSFFLKDPSTLCASGKLMYRCI